MRKVLPFVVCLAVLGAVPAQADPILFSAVLQGSNENPVNASPGVGFALVGYDPIDHTLSVLAGFTGLLDGVTAAHIHCCVDPPANTGVATEVPLFSGFPTGVTSGFYNMAFDLTQAASFNPAFVAANGGTPWGAEMALAAGLMSSRAYFNIHTSKFPGGEIRGSLRPVAAAVPEPTTMLLVGTGMGALVVARRKKRLGRAA